MLKEVEVTVNFSTGRPMSRRQIKRYQREADAAVCQIMDDLRPIIVEDIRASIQREVEGVWLT